MEMKGLELSRRVEVVFLGMFLSLAGCQVQPKSLSINSDQPTPMMTLQIGGSGGVANDEGVGRASSSPLKEKGSAGKRRLNSGERGENVAEEESGGSEEK